MSFFTNLWGTSKAFFLIGLGALGVRLKNLGSGNGLAIRNAVDDADLNLTVNQLKNNADSIEINADAADTSTDRKLTLARNPAASAAVTIVFPAAKGTDGQFFRQKAGTASNVIELEHAEAGGGGALTTDTTSIAFGTSSPAAMFQLPVGAVVDYIDIIVDEAFDGAAPTGSVGITGTTSKFVSATDFDLKSEGQYRTHPGLPAEGSAQDLIFTLSPDSSTEGAARVIVAYSLPT